MKKPKKPKKKKHKKKIKISGSFKKKPQIEEPAQVPKEPKQKQLKKNLPLIISIVIIFVLLGYIVKDDFIPDKTDKIMQCIADNAQLFATTTCSFCAQQKEWLGNYSSLFNITYCNQNPAPCMERGIGSVPFWVINGEGYLGLKTVEELKEIAGC